jgi:hypothetical protein
LVKYRHIDKRDHWDLVAFDIVLVDIGSGGQCRLSTFGLDFARSRDRRPSLSKLAALESVIDADLKDVSVVVLGDAFRVTACIGFITQFDVYGRTHVPG